MPPAAPDSVPVPETLRRWLAAHARSVTGIVLAVTVLALALRFVFLGNRIAHWDEARVAYWIAHYQDTGSFAYRHITHGPFIQIVNRWTFALLGTNDFAMRLPVAIVGGLLPASALLFREHLRDSELVTLAVLLAINPVVLYYSRFMRSDVLVAAFMFVAFGLAVRYYDTRKHRYLYGVAAFAAMGFASKENAAVYVITWVGAAALLADVALYRPRHADNGLALLWAKVQAVRASPDEDCGHTSLMDLEDAELAAVAAAWVPLFVAVFVLLNTFAVVRVVWYLDVAVTVVTTTSLAIITTAIMALADVRDAVARRAMLTGYALLGASLLFGALLLFFYAPRGAGMAGIRHPPKPPGQGAIGLWEGVGALLSLDIGTFLAMVDATWAHASTEFGRWFGKAGQTGGRSLVNQYVEFLGRFVRVMYTNAVAVTGFAVFGTLLERYGSDRSRNLVMFAAYWGFVSVLGYPLGTDIFGAWIVVHAVVPLSIPAAAGVGRVYRWGFDSLLAENPLRVTISAAILVLVLAQVVTAGIGAVYVNDQSGDNRLVQYAQPADNPRGEVRAMRRAASENRQGPDVVVYYGPRGDGLAERTAADDPYDEQAGLVRAERFWDDRRIDFRPHCLAWFNALPLPWYFASTNADVACERERLALEQRARRDDPPPVIITVSSDTTVPRLLLDEYYVSRTHRMRTFGTRMTFWVRPEYATWSNRTRIPRGGG